MNAWAEKLTLLIPPAVFGGRPLDAGRRGAIVVRAGAGGGSAFRVPMLLLSQGFAGST